MADFIYPPSSEAEWDAFGLNMTTLIGKAPESYFFTAAQYTVLQSAYDASHEAYIAGIQPTTRTASAVSLKDEKLEEFKGIARPMVAQMQANPDITNQQRIDLWLRVHSTNPTPTPTPAFPPGTQLFLMGGNLVRAIFSDVENPHRRAKPVGVRQIMVWTHSGATPPTELKDWQLQAVSGKTTVEFILSEPAGTTVWVCGQWVNSRNIPGPTSMPVSLQLGGGGAMLAA